MTQNSMHISQDKLAAARVLVVGDAMLDRYWYGAVDRISPEAPVPVVRVTRTEERVGGAANVASNIVALGTKASLLSVVGLAISSKHWSPKQASRLTLAAIPNSRPPSSCA
jgi:bifunctional ADP-heptose synthase (sugar kinase/adenylyltransferase)